MMSSPHAGIIWSMFTRKQEFKNGVLAERANWYIGVPEIMMPSGPITALTLMDSQTFSEAPVR